MIKHALYTRNQVASTWNWRLGHHHTELLGNIREFMTPVMTTIDNLVNKLSALTQNMDSLFLEISTMRQTLSMSALGTIPVQATPAPVPAAGQLWEAQRGCFHSTALPEARNKQLESPDSSPVCPRVKGPVAGKCPVIMYHSSSDGKPAPRQRKHY